jgi:hypothetical protein
MVPCAFDIQLSELNCCALESLRNKIMQINFTAINFAAYAFLNADLFIDKVYCIKIFTDYPYEATVYFFEPHRHIET